MGGTTSGMVEIRPESVQQGYLEVRAIIPLPAELTTIEAANLLNMSRPFLIKQSEAGVLPHHMVGTHRRLRLADVLAYRDRLDAQADDALHAMTAEAEELGLYE
jgi:excisionase family DNA binding protein